MFVAWLLAVLFAALGTPAFAASGDAMRLHAIFDEYFEWQKRESPEYATFLGDDRYNDRLSDLSSEAIARRKEYLHGLLARVRAIPTAKLADQDKVSHAALASLLARADRLNAFPRERMPMAGNYGPQLDLAYLLKATPFRDLRDYERYLARLRAVPKLLSQVEALMRDGIATKWVLPAQALQAMPGQIDAWVADAPERSPAWRPFETLPASIGESDRSRLAAEARRAIADDVTPAFQRLKRFVVTTYLANARSDLGASTLPGGTAYYEALVADQTTTSLSPREIHDIGLREVARIATEMDRVMRDTGFTGSRNEFFRFLRESPQFYLTDGEQMLVRYRDIAKRVDAELPKLFFELPRLPYGIRGMEKFEGDNAEHYTLGSPEIGRAGFFEANLNNLRTRPTYNMENTFLHEAVPGHHLQIARAQEMRDLPQFRRHSLLGAYTEGWALYAESLGDELGLYKDEYSRFGRLSWEMVRACRLVIDTGIHAFAWDRARAIDYMMDNAGLTDSFAAAEIDRYIATPGQALGYKLGELRIMALREKARAALGGRFDVRRFHNALLDDGALPLDVLDARIDAWISRERRRIDAPANARAQIAREAR